MQITCYLNSVRIQGKRQKSQNSYLLSKKIPINRYGKSPNRYRVSKKELPSLLKTGIAFLLKLRSLKLLLRRT